MLKYGIGRVGNSADEYYIGPEYLHESPPPFGSTRDDTGAIKRQAAKFRIVGYNKHGMAVAELTAEVTLDGRDVPVVGAWVVIGPPDNAPGIVPFRSMYDMIRHATLDVDNDTSYTLDILPLPFNLSNLQWVNVGFARVFGEDGLHPIDSELIKTLAKPDSHLKRFEIFEQFRPPDDDSNENMPNVSFD